MKRIPELSLILPAYNEAGAIHSTLDEVQAYLDGVGLSYEVLVSADGDDGTRDAVARRARRDPRVQVQGGPGRRGKGRGVREGVARARGRLIGFADADNKTPISELEKVFPWLEAGWDVVIGSRALGDSRVEVAQPLYRRLSSRCFGLGMHLLTGLWEVHDTQCGFKFFQGEVARDLFARQRIDGYMFDVEVLYLAARAGYRIKEVGVRWRDDGDSRLELVRGNWRNLIDLLRIRFGGIGKEEQPAPARLPLAAWRKVG
jgi:dolichyl-phosphate beta-glucosyltransferase